MACRRSLLFFVALMLLLAGSSSDAASSPEATVLLQFKGTISDSTGALKTWDAKTVPCSKNTSNWPGVLCDDEGHVSGLRLEGMSLSGSLSQVALLGGLTALRTLSFSKNSFEGPMPEVGKLHRLRAVFLSMNKFSGEIPANAFDGMSSLKKLYLSGNDFSGPIPASIARLPKLLELTLDGNRFSGTIPELESQDLKVLNVSGNYLEGPIPESLSKVDSSAFADNKDLCGEPLKTACRYLSSPSIRSSGGKSRQRSAFFTALAIFILAGIIFVLFIIPHRRQPQDEQLSTKPAAKLEPSCDLKKLEGGGGGFNRGSSTGRKSVSARVEHRLIFVRQGRERFELQGLLKSSAEVLGTGSLGSSYVASLSTGHSVVVKRFRDMNRVGREDFEEHMRRLGRLSHPNLLPLVAYYYRKDEKLLVMDYVTKRTLSNALHGFRAANLPALDWPTRLKIVRGIAKGLNYLYEELQMLSIPHGQLKSSHIFLSDSFEPLLDAYALVPVLNQASASQLMVAYKTPECKQNGKTSKKSDVWCLGILILEILTGKIPVTDAQEGQETVDLESWVNSVPEEEWTGKVIDREMSAKDTSEEEIIKLLKIALASCEENIEKRYELEQVLDRIDELKDEA